MTVSKNFGNAEIWKKKKTNNNKHLPFELAEKTRREFCDNWDDFFFLDSSFFFLFNFSFVHRIAENVPYRILASYTQFDQDHKIMMCFMFQTNVLNLYIWVWVLRLVVFLLMTNLVTTAIDTLEILHKTVVRMSIFIIVAAGRF